MQHREVADPSVRQTLVGHATQLALRHVEPTAVLRGVNKVDPPHVVASLVGREGFVERPLGVRVQIVADQRDPLDAGIARIEQMGDFMSPVVLGAARPGRRLAEAGQRLGRSLALPLSHKALA